MRLFFPLSGDDVFISYSRRDGARYAAGMADKLTEKKLTCFIDKLGVKPDHDLPADLIKKIRRCTVFVIVGTEKAAHSKFVEKEIAEFKKTGRTILPIDFDGNVGKSIWYEEIPGLPVESEKDTEALETGNPSQNVVGFVEKSFRYTRRNQHMFRMFWGAMSVFLILVALSLAGVFVARNQVTKAAEATIKADEETKRANAARDLASGKEAEARQKTEEARIAKLGAEASRKEAAKAAVVAKQQSDLAIEKTRIANLATRHADEQTKLAREKTTEANRLLYAANARLSDSLYKDFDARGFTNILENSDPTFRGIEWEYLSQLTKGLVKFRDLPGEAIDSIVFSPDGKYLLTHLQSTKQLLKWDLQTGLSETLGQGASSDLVDRFSFSPNKRWLVTGGPTSDGLVIWDISTSSWKRHVIPTDYKDRRGFVSFTADSQELVTIQTYKGEVSLQHWDIKNRTKAAKSATKKFGDHVEILQFSPVGQTVIRNTNFGEESSEILLLDSNLNKTNITKEEIGMEVREVAFSSNGKRIALFSISPRRRSLYGIFVFDTSAEKPQLVALPEALVFSRNLKNLTPKLALSDNGQLLALGFENGIRVLDLDKNVAIKEVPLEFSSRGSVSLASNGSLLAVNDAVISQNISSNTNRLTLWSLGSQSEVFTFEEMRPIVNCPDCYDVISDDGSKLVAQDGSGAWTLWDTFSRKKMATISLGAVNSGQERRSLFSPTGEYFFTVIIDPSGSESLLGSQLRLWDTTTGKEIDLSSGPQCKFISNPVFSSDGRFVAVACKEGHIGVWQAKSGEKIRNIEIARRGNELQLQLLQNDRMILVTDETVGNDYYDFESGVAIQPDQFSLKVQSPDNKWRVYGNKSTGYFLQNLLDKTSAPLLLLEPRKFQAPSITFSGDSKLLNVFGVGEDVLTKAKVFTRNLVTMENIKSESSEGLGSFEVSPQNSWLIEITKSKIHYSSIKPGMNKTLSQCPGNPTFSSDEKRLITSCFDGTIKFWDLLSGQEVLSIKAHQSGVKKLALSKDEKYMLTVSETDAKLWRIKF